MKLFPISRSEAARYMGIKGEPDAAVAELLDRSEELVRERLRPKYVYLETDVSFSEEGVILGAMNVPLTGNDIRRHLSGCGRALLLAATLTSEADKLIRQAAVTNMAESLAIDCLCSAAVEQVCDRAEEEFFASHPARYRTWRFSAGYGDFPLSLQREFLLALNAQRRIGLTVTENSLLIPSKSVTAVVGISDKPLQKGGHGCEVCSLRENCGYRSKGIKCHE